jgi:4-amino-4-deoxy-L-arabinose transferase-like glycosyltransferase
VTELAAAEGGSHARLLLPSLLVLFVAALVPFAGTFFQHYPDERNYTNAAITMVQSGDYLTPRWPDGRSNLHKPIVAYWVVAASYKIFGITLPASRLPFMVAGALIIAATYVTGLALTGRRDTALLAAVITASEPQLILSSMRAIPDVLLCLFMLLSAYGFLGLVVLGRRTAATYWSAYLGAALAIETKGLLALVFVAFAWVFALLERGAEPARNSAGGSAPLPNLPPERVARAKPARERGTPTGRTVPSGWRRSARSRLRSLLHAPSMLVALAVAISWYVAMYGLHRDRLVKIFFGDQITYNVQVLDGTPLIRIPIYLGLLLINLLPWSVLLVPLAIWDRQSFRLVDASLRRAQRFIVLWAVLMAIVFGLGNQIEPRYLLPAGPLLAILLAHQIARADLRLTTRAIAYLAAAALVLLAVLGLALSLLDALVMGTGPALLALALSAVVVTMIALAIRGGVLPAAVSVPLSVVLAFSLIAIALGPALEPDAGVKTMVRELERTRRNGAEPVLVTGPEHLANKLRVASAGRIAIDSWSRLDDDHRRWPERMIIPVGQAAGIDLTSYRSREVATEVRRVPVVGLLHAMASGRVTEFFDLRRDRYVLAVRR